MKESSEKKVVLKAIHSRGLEPLLDFLYGGALKVTADNLEEVLGAAGYLQINVAIDACWCYMRSNLSVSTCVEYMRIGELFSCTSIISRVEKFISENLTKWAETKEHMCLPYDVVKEYTDKAENIADISLYRFVTSWLAANKQTEDEENELLRCIKFHCIPEVDLKDIQLAEPALSNTYIQRQVSQALEYQRDGVTLKDRIRIGTPDKLVRDRHLLFVFGGEQVTYHGKLKKRCVTETDTFHVNVGAGWYKTATPLPKLTKSAITTHRGMIFACGGLTLTDPHAPSYSPSHQCYVFDPIVWRWEQLANMNQKRSSLAVAGHEDFLYAFGGVSDPNHAVLSSMERYSLREDCWEKVSSTPSPVCGLVATGDEKVIYVYGGKDDKNNLLHSFHSFNPLSGEWTSLSVPRCTALNCYLSSHNDHLILVNPDSEYICVFSKTIGQWMYIKYSGSSLMASKSFVTFNEDTLYYIGGKRHNAEIGKEFHECRLVTFALGPGLQCKFKKISVMQRKGNISRPMCAWIRVPYFRKRARMHLSLDDRERFRPDKYRPLTLKAPFTNNVDWI